LQLRQAFVTAMLARDNLKLAQLVDDQYNRTEQLTAIRTQSGDLPGVELYRVRANRLAYRQAVIDAGNAYQQATRDVLNLLNAEDAAPGQPPTAVEIIGGFTDRPISRSLGELRVLTLERRPDVQLARR